MGNPITVRILDTYRRAGVLSEHSLRLSFERPRISLAELIERRVVAEVESYHQTTDQKQSLIELDDKELLLNESTRRPRKVLEKKPIDIEKAVEKALTGFRRSAYFVIVDGEQVTELDHMLELQPQTEVEFFRLVPLVGG